MAVILRSRYVLPISSPPIENGAVVVDSDQISAVGTWDDLRSQEGEVIAAGLGKYREDGSRQSLDVKAGDRVLFGKYSSSEIKVDGEELLIMREDEILGIIKRAGAAAGGKKSK